MKSAGCSTRFFIFEATSSATKLWFQLFYKRREEIFIDRFAGFLLVGFSFLTAAIVFTLAEMSQNVDEIDGSYGGMFGQIPPLVFLFLLIPLVIGLTLTNKKDSNK